MPKKTTKKAKAKKVDVPKVKPEQVPVPQPAKETAPLVKNFDSPEGKERKTNMKKNILLASAIILTILLGVGSGYILALKKSGNLGSLTDAGLKRSLGEGEEISKGTKVGMADEKTFRDNAEGDLEKGGVDGEGSHHLVRPGGESQNVYLTSSVIDLDQFVGRKVKVWGETFAAQKAGWLMDVGKLEVLE